MSAALAARHVRQRDQAVEAVLQRAGPRRDGVVDRGELLTGRARMWLDGDREIRVVPPVSRVVVAEDLERLGVRFGQVAPAAATAALSPLRRERRRRHEHQGAAHQGDDNDPNAHRISLRRCEAATIRRADGARNARRMNHVRFHTASRERGCSAKSLRSPCSERSTFGGRVARGASVSVDLRQKLATDEQRMRASGLL
jgi:hypothetical protein